MNYQKWKKITQQFVFFSQRQQTKLPPKPSACYTFSYIYIYISKCTLSFQRKPRKLPEMDKLSSTTRFESVHYGIVNQMNFIWQQARVPLIVPVLKLLVVLCLTMSVMLFVERVYMGIVIVFLKLFGHKPEKHYKWEAFKDDDIELGNCAFPMVLVQIPMYNEKEVYITVKYIKTKVFLEFLFLYLVMYLAILFFALI